MSTSLIIGVISDTHGLLRPEALRAMEGSDLILHAGDIGGPEILESLRRIAPVHAVRGNVDTSPWAAGLPERLVVEAGGHRITIIHNRADIGRLDDSTDIVVCGHSHKGNSEIKSGVFYFNPGSAGPRRFRLPVTCGRLTLKAGTVEPEILQLVRP